MKIISNLLIGIILVISGMETQRLFLTEQSQDPVYKVLSDKKLDDCAAMACADSLENKIPHLVCKADMKKTADRLKELK
jgi:hypothetical protein